MSPREEKIISRLIEIVGGGLRNDYARYGSPNVRQESLLVLSKQKKTHLLRGIGFSAGAGVFLGLLKSGFIEEMADSKGFEWALQVSVGLWAVGPILLILAGLNLFLASIRNSEIKEISEPPSESEMAELLHWCNESSEVGVYVQSAIKKGGVTLFDHKLANALFELMAQHKDKKSKEQLERILRKFQ